MSISRILKMYSFSIEISFNNVKKFSSFRGKPLTPIIRDLLALIICCSVPSDCISSSSLGFSVHLHNSPANIT
jgi:hypothetical protein